MNNSNNDGSKTPAGTLPQPFPNPPLPSNSSMMPWFNFNRLFHPPPALSNPPPGNASLSNHVSVNKTTSCPPHPTTSSSQASTKPSTSSTRSDDNLTQPLRPMPPIRNGNSCTLCGKYVTTKHGMARHMKIIHEGAEESKCDICGRMFTTKFALHRHIRKVHEGVPDAVLPCSCCGKTFSAKHGLERHMRLIHESAELCICPLCNRSFSTKFAFNRHTKTVHATTLIVCGACDVAFPSKFVLLEHNLTMHNTSKIFACAECMKSFPDSESRKTHLRVEHSIRRNNSFKEPVSILKSPQPYPASPPLLLRVTQAATMVLKSEAVLGRDAREKCWSARDAYWDCVVSQCSKLHLNDPESPEVVKSCQSLRQAYTDACPETWVKLFDKKRSFDLFKSQMYEAEIKATGQANPDLTQSK